MIRLFPCPISFRAFGWIWRENLIYTQNNPAFRGFFLLFPPIWVTGSCLTVLKLILKYTDLLVSVTEQIIRPQSVIFLKFEFGHFSFTCNFSHPTWASCGVQTAPPESQTKLLLFVNVTHGKSNVNIDNFKDFFPKSTCPNICTYTARWFGALVKRLKQVIRWLFCKILSHYIIIQ